MIEGTTKVIFIFGIYEKLRLEVSGGHSSHNAAETTGKLEVVGNR
jgi:hypothetical protein